MPEKARALEPPPIARENAEAVEVLGIWASLGSPQQIVLRHDVEGPWRLRIVASGRRPHLAQVYTKEGHDKDATLARIRELFDAE